MAQVSCGEVNINVQQQQERQRITSLSEEDVKRLNAAEKAVAEAVETHRYTDHPFCCAHPLYSETPSFYGLCGDPVAKMENWANIAHELNLDKPTEEDKRVVQILREFKKRLDPEVAVLINSDVENISAPWKRLHRAALRLGHAYVAEQLLWKITTEMGNS